MERRPDRIDARVLRLNRGEHAGEMVVVVVVAGTSVVMVADVGPGSLVVVVVVVLIGSLVVVVIVSGTGVLGVLVVVLVVFDINVVLVVAGSSIVVA